MARAREAGRRSPRAGAATSLVLLFLLGVHGGPALPRAGAGGPPAAELVAAASRAYATDGTLAVAVARQHRPPTGMTLRAAEARRARVAAGVADNGPAAHRPVPVASMVKLYLAEDVLHRARAGDIALVPTDRHRLEWMIRSSDDPAASALWVRFDGAQAVRDVAARYGLTGTAPPAVPGQWGRALTTAVDLARFLALLPVVAHADDAAELLGWMRTATPVAADGFDQRFGLFGTVAGLPAVKQGWMCCVGGKRHLHSVAVIGSRVVVLLSEVPRAVSYDAARAALTAAAAALPPPLTP